MFSSAVKLGILTWVTMGLSLFCSQPLVASRWTAVSVTSVLDSRERPERCIWWGIDWMVVVCYWWIW